MYSYYEFDGVLHESDGDIPEDAVQVTREKFLESKFIVEKNRLSAMDNFTAVLRTEWDNKHTLLLKDGLSDVSIRTLIGERP